MDSRMDSSQMVTRLISFFLRVFVFSRRRTKNYNFRKISIPKSNYRRVYCMLVVFYSYFIRAKGKGKDLTNKERNDLACEHNAYTNILMHNAYVSIAETFFCQVTSTDVRPKCVPEARRKTEFNSHSSAIQRCSLCNESHSCLISANFTSTKNQERQDDRNNS